MRTISDEDVKAIAEEVATHTHICQLSKDERDAINMVGGFFSRVKNALGWFSMVVIFTVIIAVLGGFFFLVSAGRINIFKVFGLGE